MATDTTQQKPGTDISLPKYQNYAQSQVDEQAILDKFNAATIAQYNVQREQNRQAENQFYNQMYNTQKTAMDTIRQNNAAAVATGASRGVQAANELSAILGLQQESVAGATELAQANRQTAQEETAAVLENVLNAYQQAVAERQQLVSQGIEAASIDAQTEANQISAMEAQAALQNAKTNRDQLLQSAAETGSLNYLAATAAEQGVDLTGAPTTAGTASLSLALRQNTDARVTGDDWKGTAHPDQKGRDAINTLKQACAVYGLNYDAYKDLIADYEKVTTKPNVNFTTKIKDTGLAEKYGLSGNNQGKAAYADLANTIYNTITQRIISDYSNNTNRIKANNK